MKLKKALSSFLAFVLLLSCMSITAFADAQTPVSYLSPVYNTADTPSSGVKEWETLNCTTYTEISSDQSEAQTWNAGWYVVTGADVKYTAGITINGEVNLILCDGAKLTVTGGYTAINADSHLLTIYAQSNGTGALSATGTGQGIFASYLTINGGNISGTGSYAGFNYSNTMIQNGGTVTVSGTYALRKGDVFINGGNVTANGYEKGISAYNATINGGAVTATATGSNATAFYCSDALTVRDGTVTATGIDEGLLAYKGITIEGGTVTATAATAFVVHGNSIVISPGLSVKTGASQDAATEVTHLGYNATSLAGAYASVSPAQTFTLTGASSLSGQGGVTFTVGGSAVTEAYQGTTVTAAAAAVKGCYAVLSASSNVTDFNASTGSFTMPDGAVTITATYSPAAYDITNGTPESGKATNHGYITLSAESAEENTEITVTAYPADGYKLDTLTYIPEGGEAAAITNGTFTMPAYAVTVSATFSEIVTSGTIDLDLEDSTADIPESIDIDQYYTKTEASSIVYNHRIGVTWWTDAGKTTGDNDLVIQVNAAVKWDPSKLSWVTDDALNGVASVQEGTNKVNFLLSNYSAKAFTCSITYAANAEDTCANKTANTVVFDSNNGATLAMVNNDMEQTDVTNPAYLTEGAVDLTKVPTLLITGTVGVDLDGFKGAAANSTPAKYGRFTITCQAVND